MLLSVWQSSEEYTSRITKLFILFIKVIKIIWSIIGILSGVILDIAAQERQILLIFSRNKVI
jgi:hypothetical protein